MLSYWIQGNYSSLPRLERTSCIHKCSRLLIRLACFPLHLFLFLLEAQCSPEQMSINAHFVLDFETAVCLLTIEVSQLLRETWGTLENDHRVAWAAACCKWWGWGIRHTLHSRVCSHGSYFPLAENSRDSWSCEHVLGSWVKLNTCPNFSFFPFFQYWGAYTMAWPKVW